MTPRSPIGRLLALLIVTLAAASCGATPPQAPPEEAARLDIATGNISTACGLAYQVTAFSEDHKSDLETLEATASSAAKKLASVYARNPAWIYQGETVEEIVRDSLAMLSTCGLTRAEHTLRQATAHS